MCHCRFHDGSARLHRRLYSSAKSCTDFSALPSDTLDPKPQEAFSVRVRDRGPDYRTFVTVSQNGSPECHHDNCKTAQDARLRSLSEAASVSNGMVAFQCEHIQHVQRLQSSLVACEDSPLHLNPEVLKKLPFPLAIQQSLQSKSQQTMNLIQRVSDETFAVGVEQTQEHQLGLLHVRFGKAKSTTPATLPTFYCPCTAYKRYSSVHSVGGGTTPKVSKRCLHFYLCLWAFASAEDPSKEFSTFLAEENRGT